jgi:hypothetical protein
MNLLHYLLLSDLKRLLTYCTRLEVATPVECDTTLNFCETIAYVAETSIVHCKNESFKSVGTTTNNRHISHAATVSESIGSFKYLVRP